ncbi:MAG: PEP-CTERM sorting domain-containing protein [Planctomycetota bacterium]|nr:PEP-CTERM sorting domain-containing protein [Planctomycetota bacterium]
MSDWLQRARPIMVVAIGCLFNAEARAGGMHHPLEHGAGRGDARHGFRSTHAQAYREQDNPRQAARDIKVYNDVVAMRNANPTRFDQLHPFYKQLLTSQSFFDSIVNRWHLDQPRFEHWHPLLWRVLDGGVLERNAINTTPPGPDPVSGAFGSPDPTPIPSLTPNPPHSIGPPSPPPPPPASATPEPSSLALLATGFAAFGFFLHSRRETAVGS